MSRAGFQPLPGEGGPAVPASQGPPAGRVLLLRQPSPAGLVNGAGPPAPARRPGQAGKPPQEGRPGQAWRSFACRLEAGAGWRAVSALLDRLPEIPPRVVILDLAGSAGADGNDCAALRWLQEQLAAAGSRLWLAAAPCAVAAPLAEHGVAGLHPSRRAAVLALFAALPGPGVVTAEVRAALAAPPEPLLPG
jgi:hypothetical protein